jgi:hypothetical protein
MNQEASTRRSRIDFLVSLLLAASAPALLQACDARKYPTHDLPIPMSSDGGAVEVSGTFNQCPGGSFGVSPMTGHLDQPFSLAAVASDPDDSGTLTFTWSASSGAFDDQHARMTMFHCAQPGPVTIVLTVSDGSCPTMVSAPIYCLGDHQDAAAPDDGPPAGTGGAGGRTGTGGSSGGGTGGSRGTGGSPGTGGMGSTCPTEPGGGNADSMCSQCTMDNCSLAPPGMNGGTDGCCALTAPADQQLCQAVVLCYAANSDGCTTAGDPTNCFCGSSPLTCFSVPGAANGPCAGAVIAAARTSDPTKIKPLFISPTSPLGRATNLTTCRGSFCPMECNIK